MRPGDQLVLGASNPVRDAALVGLNTQGIQVRSNRGVAGIDGTVSTAIGAALAHEGRTIALIGDLTFVHDSSGLLIGPTEPTPRNLTIVVSNDNGGGIFELLEQGDPRFSDVSSRIFGTPHDVDVGALCRAYHVESRQIEADGPRRCARRALRRDARAGGEGRPVVAAGPARIDQGRPVSGATPGELAKKRAKVENLARKLIPRLSSNSARDAIAANLSTDTHRHCDRGVPGDAAVGADGGRGLAHR